MYPVDAHDRSTGIYRLIVVLFFFGLACGSAVLLLTVLQVIEPGFALGGLSPAGEKALSILDDLYWTNRLVIAAGSVVVGTLAISVLLRMFARPAVSAVLHILEADDSGFVAVDSRSISTIAAQAALVTPGVIYADVSLTGTGTSPVRLRVEAGVYPGAQLKRCGNEVREAVRGAVETLVGVGVRDVTVKTYAIETDALVRVMR